MKKQLFTKFSFALALIGLCNSGSLKAQTGAAINFDGVNDFVNLGSTITSSLVNTNQITVEAWVRPSVNTGFGAIVANYGTSGPGMQFLLRRDGSNYTFFTSNGTFNQISAAASVTLNTWTHLAGTWDGAIMRFFINGIASGTAAATGSFTPFSAPVWIGGETAGGGEYFNGNIDEVRIWKVARSQGDIQNSMNCEINGASTNLIANYHFNQGIAASANTTVTTLFDDSGNSINGTVSNVVFALTGATSNWVAPGGVASGLSCNGAALNFNGTNNSVNLGTAINASFAPLSKVTLEAWVKPSSTAGLGIIVGNYAPANQMQFLLRRGGATEYQFFIGNGNIGNYMQVNSVAIPTVGIWQHIAGAYNGTVASIYVNGVLSATAAISYTFGTTTNPLVIGGTGAEYFGGDIDEVRIWNRALCQGEIQNNMIGEIPTIGNGLVANYHFNQGIAACTNTAVTTLTDASGNAYTGTLTSIALTTGTVSNWVKPGGVLSGSNVAAFVSPTIAISSSTTICSGNSTTLTASGVGSYTWTSGPTTSTFAVTPTVTTTYSVIGTATNGCVSSLATRTINVNATPTIAVNNGTICSGNIFTILPGGASTYTIQGGNANVSPTTNASYTVIGTSTAGCVSANTATSNVTVNANPTVTALSNTSLICVGQTASLTANGAATYSWNTTATTTVIAVSPTVNTTYTVTGITNGCIGTTTITQAVSPCTGIQSLTNVNSLISVYPNPSNGMYTIETENATTVNVFDALGKVVYTQKLADGKHIINLSNLNNGLYILKAESNGQFKTGRLIKE